MDHEHYQWLADVSKSIVDSYEREQEMARQPGNIQRTGHRVESRWHKVLSDWLPPQYAIEKRKYLLLETVDGPRATREHDLVVFYPALPGSSKEAGWSPGFWCRGSVQHQAHDRPQSNCRGVSRRSNDSPGHEDTRRDSASLPCATSLGLLGESQDWRNADDPKAKIRAIVDELDRVEVKAPREGLDMLCVADLGYWGRSTSVLTEQFLTSQTDEMTVALAW